MYVDLRLQFKIKNCIRDLRTNTELTPFVMERFVRWFNRSDCTQLGMQALI